MATHAPAPVRYSVTCHDRRAHLFAVVLDIEAPAARQRVWLPVWIPGSYLVREFSKNLLSLRARQGRRMAPVTQINKNTWEIDCQPGERLQLQYEVCAYDPSVRAAWLDESRGFFNATSLCLRVEGQTDGPLELLLHVPEPIAGSPRWRCATTLRPVRADRQGFGLYRAADYDELADSPVEMGDFWQGEFTACGVPHRFIVAGAPAAFDGDRLLADAQTICEAQMRFWHGDKAGQRGGPKPPHDRYLFILNAVHDGYGGLEHRYSTALICSRRDLPRVGAAAQPEGYTALLGLISHEYFHVWNVKRLRPIEFERYDYGHENYTTLLWFFEGFTSYYDDLLLRRAHLIDDANYLRLLGKSINQVLQTPGRRVQTVAQAGFDAWVKYYRPDEQTPNTTVSYYAKGALVALCLDLTLRAEGASLDAVMRRLWQQSGGGPIDEAAIAQALHDVSGRSYARELARWVHSTDELPLASLLRAQGAAVLEEPAQHAQTLGLRVDESGGTVQIKAVLHGSAAHKAGLTAGDEWIGIELPATRSQPVQGWRINKLDELALHQGTRRKITALVARDRRLLRLPVTLPNDTHVWRLVPQDETKLAQWLARG